MARTDPSAARRFLDHARQLHAAGRMDEALAAYAQALKHEARLKEARFGMTSILEMARTTAYNAGLAGLMEECLADREANHQALARGAALQLRLKYRLDRLPQPGESELRALVERFAGDRLLHLFLSRTVNLDPVLERVLTAVRRHFLLSSEAIPPAFGAALAHQCFNAEYSWWQDEAETRLLSGLPRTVDPGAPDLQHLLRLALYMPLSDLPDAPALALRSLHAWPEPLRPLITASLQDPLEERAIAASLRSFSPITDAVSARVQSMYEASPYPRWLSLPPLPEIDLIAELQHRFPFMATPPVASGQPLRVLSGGCGTGQHPLTLAANYRRAEVTAFDLSRSSLAYAIRQSRRFRVRNVEFFHGDILNVAALGRRFDVIESIGVIHHMEDPAAGLRAFTAVLEPGGLVRLGLYSEQARRRIVAARARIAELGLSSGGPDDIRRFRHLLMTDPAYADLAELTGWDDFYATSAARDLMFHVQEHRYTVDGIADLVRSAGLVFLGFEFIAGFSSSNRPSVAAHARYRELFPNEPTLSDLDNWALIERRHPEIFQGFTFWTQKPHA